MTEEMTEEEKDGGVEISRPEGEGSSGINIEMAEGEIAPPLTEERLVEEEQVEREVTGKQVTGAIPISPAVIKPPLRLEGSVLAQMTGYPGWMYTDEELDAIAELITECGWTMKPQLQVILALGTLHGGKFMAMKMWEKSGRLGDLRRKHKTGEEPVQARPGEEVVA